MYHSYTMFDQASGKSPFLPFILRPQVPAMSWDLIDEGLGTEYQPQHRIEDLNDVFA